MSGLNVADHDRIKEMGACFIKESTDRYTVYNTPDLGIGHLMNVETYKDKPIVFQMRFSKIKYTHAVDIFTNRFGKPLKVVREPIRTSAGVAYESRKLIWEGPKLRIQLSEIGNDIRWSDGVIVNIPLANEKSRREKSTAKAAAEKL